MSNVTLCRVCLASNTRMHHIANTRYQEIFEKLSTKLITADRRPVTVCYICHSQLQRCLRFMDMSQKAEEILTQFSLSGIELSEDTVNILDRKFVRKITWTPLQILSINDVNELSQMKLEIKEEPSDNLELFNEISENERPFTDTHQTQETISEDKNDSEKEKLSEIITFNVLKQEPINEDEVISEKGQLNSEKGLPSSEKGLLSSEKGQLICKKGLQNSKKGQLFSGKGQLSEKVLAVKKERVKQELDYEEGEYVTELEIEDPQNIYEVTLTNSDRIDKEGRLRYQCNQCDKAYIQKCHLYRHKKTHQLNSNGTPSRNYTCEICGKAFVQKSTLNKHFLSHRDDKPFCCDHCPTKCSQKIDMIRHMMLHTGLKPYQCDICKLSFNRKSNMKLHIQTHTDVKPFVCNICNGTFTRLYDLNRHRRRKHACEKPYTCDICDFRSPNASYVKVHMKKKHKI